MTKRKETKIIGAKHVFAWIFSVLFIVGGMGTFSQSFLSGIFTFMAGLILLPPFNKFLEKKYNLKITTWLKIIIVLVLLVFSGMAIPSDSYNNSNSENLATNDNSVNQNQLQKIFEETNVYRFRTLKGYETNLVLVNSSSEDNLTKGYTIAIENTCGITIPDNYFLLFDTGTLLIIDAETYEVKCDYLNLQDSKTGQPVSQDELSSFISNLEEQEKQTTPQTTTPTDTATMGEKNALSSALSYLAYSAFSHSGLIDQLEYEGYSYQEAKYAADNCGADWNEQAALKAESYLKYSAFSRQGLIDQLEFEGFTQSQAEYGVQAVGY